MHARAASTSAGWARYRRAPRATTVRLLVRAGNRWGAWPGQCPNRARPQWSCPFSLRFYSARTRTEETCIRLTAGVESLTWVCQLAVRADAMLLDKIMKYGPTGTLRV